MNDFNPEWIIVHCAATPPSMSEVDALWIARLHRRKGWMGGGYHEVITRPHNGSPAQRQNAEAGYPTRKLDRAGAHVGGCGRAWNMKTIGICLAGGVDSRGVAEDNFTSEQIELLLEAIREYQERFSIPDERVIGHRDLIRMTNAAPKACPSMSVQALLSQGKTRSGGKFNFKIKGDASALAIPETHKVRKGESLWGISHAYGVSLEQLTAWNNLSDPDSLRAGSTLTLRP